MAQRNRLPSVEVIQDLYRQGLDQTEIGARYGVTRSAVNIKLQRAGVTVAGTRPVEIRFWAKVDRQGPDDCWLWTGAA